MNASQFLSVGATLVLTMTSACGGDTHTAPPNPSVMRIIGVNNVSWTAGLKFPVAFEVSLQSADGAALPRVSVLWTVTSGGGIVGGEDSPNHGVSGYLIAIPSDERGNSTVIWTLGPVLGPQTLTASVSGFVGSPATFFATATPP